MASNLLLDYSRGGGAPPTNSELLHVYLDGLVTYLVGNSLAAGSPQNEAGLYRFHLAPSDFESVKQLLSQTDVSKMKDEYGPVRADSGFDTLHLYAKPEKDIRWGPFSKLPGALETIAERLSKIVAEARQHPDQTLKASIYLPDEAERAGDIFPVELKLENISSTPLRFQLGNSGAESVRLYVTASQHQAGQIIPLSYYRSALPGKQIEPSGSGKTDGRFEMNAGEGISFRCGATIGPGDSPNGKIYGFIDLKLDIVADDRKYAIDCLLATLPVSLI